MKIKKFKNENILILIITIVTIAIAIIGITFAFLYAKIIGNDDASKVIIKTSDLSIEYKTLNEINAKNIYPGFTQTLNFTVTNDSPYEAAAGYKINWKIYTNDFDGNDFVYSINGTNNDSNENNIILNKSETILPKKDTIIGSGAIVGGSTQTYKLTVKFKETNVNQDENKGKNFVGKIEITSN